MKRTILSLCFCFLVSLLISQSIVLDGSKTRAVVIGISDYKNEGITDLKYAHKDAMAFASFLESSAGGQLKKDVDYKLLINEQATSANMASALDWLLKASKPKDKAIIYFSGHGDVESQTSVKHGFLLTYDSPAKVYISRAYPVFYLQSIVKTLSGQDIDVLLIADACRAGKLAGSEHGGAQAASTVLSQQLAKEIKILSCQTDEYSEESEAWGGGRGLFSYFLIRGLYGLADKNKDKQVSLMELTSYLQEKVSTNAQKSQIPKTDGSPKKIVSVVDDEMVKKLMSEPESQPLASAEVSTRGMGEKPIENAKEKVSDLIEKINNTQTDNISSLPAGTEPDQYAEIEIRDEYLVEAIEILENQFWYAIENGDFIYPEDESAYFYYNELMEYFPDSEEAHIMGAELVWAIRDEIDSVIDANLATEFIYEDNIDESLDMVDTFVEHIGTCLEILGPDHYMHDHLQAKGLYLSAKGDALYSEIVEYNREFYIQESIDANLEALEYDDSAAYIYNDLGASYAAQGNDNLAIANYKKALDLSPTWQIALANLYGAYLDTEQFELADEVKEKVLGLESDNPWIYYTFGGAYYDAQMYDEALEMYNEAKNSYDKDNYLLYNAIGDCYWYGKNDLPSAEQNYRKALSISPDAYWPSYNLAFLLYNQSNYVEAKEIALRVIDKHEYKLYFHELLGHIYIATEKYEMALDAYTKVLDQDSNYANGHINMAFFAAITAQDELAIDWVESGLKLGFNNAEYLNTHDAFANLRTMPRFQQLMSSYFGY